MRCYRHQPAPTIAEKEVIRPEWHRVERGDLVPRHNIENHKKYGCTDNFSRHHFGFRTPFAESLHGAAHPRSLTPNGYSQKRASEGPVGDRGVFSCDQAKLTGEDVRRDLGERFAVADLDGTEPCY